jgi:hypothetical protein
MITIHSSSAAIGLCPLLWPWVKKLTELLVKCGFICTLIIFKTDDFAIRETTITKETHWWDTDSTLHSIARHCHSPSHLTPNYPFLLHNHPVLLSEFWWCLTDDSVANQVHLLSCSPLDLSDHFDFLRIIQESPFKTEWPVFSRQNETPGQCLAISRSWWYIVGFMPCYIGCSTEV